MTTKLFSPLHVLKVSSPIAVTVFGMVTLVMVLFRPKAKSLMDVTPSGITTSPPLPLYFVSTPFLMVKSPAAYTVLPNAAPCRSITAIATTSVIETNLFFIFFSSLSLT